MSGRAVACAVRWWIESIVVSNSVLHSNRILAEDAQRTSYNEYYDVIDNSHTTVLFTVLLYKMHLPGVTRIVDMTLINCGLTNQ